MSQSNAKLTLDRRGYADLIVSRLLAAQSKITAEFRRPGRIPSSVVDDLLPPPRAQEIFDAFPDPSSMMEKKSLREHKLVAVQLNQLSPIIEEIVFAFQDHRVVKVAIVRLPAYSD